MRSSWSKAAKDDKYVVLSSTLLASFIKTFLSRNASPRSAAATAVLAAAAAAAANSADNLKWGYCCHFCCCHLLRQCLLLATARLSNSEADESYY